MKLGRYEVVRELGKGAMGIVYLAKDPLIGRLVALKTIRPASTDDDEAKEFQERFVREAQAAGILNHPSIVTVHDIGQDPESGISFIAMEYIEGPNLKEVLQQGRGMHFFEVAEIVAQVADALDYAHSKGIIHRDVKPANIILPAESKAKITDFGIAKIASGAANLTTTGQFLGTPNYMAPEQIKGSRVDGRSDLFSLGIVFYECLARRKPFGGDSLTTISYKIVHEPFPPLHDIDSTIPDGFEQIVARALEKDPANRYQRGRDFASDIRTIIRGESLARTPDTSAFEETLMNRERDASEKIPTLEIPFPQADATGVLGGFTDGPATAAADASPHSLTRPKARPPKAASGPGFLKSRISATAFFAVIFCLLIVGAVAVLAIQQRRVQVPAVDHRKELQVAKEKKLRADADAMLAAHNVEGAYEKYTELQQIAPGSPFVSGRIAQLQQIRSAQTSRQQVIDQANATFEQGKELYDKKDYNGAIPLFEQAFHLNPNLSESVNYLRMSREQIALQDQQNRAKLASTATSAPLQPPRGSNRTVVPTSTSAQRGVTHAPATLTTSFHSTVSDGYFVVKANQQTIITENLWEDKRGIFRRKGPRDVLINSQIPSDNVDIDVWVVVPSLKMQEHQQFKEVFPPGGARKLTISFEPGTNKVNYQWN